MKILVEDDVFCQDVLVKLGMAFRELQNHLKQKKSLNQLSEKSSNKVEDVTRHRLKKTQGFRAAGQSHVQRSFISKGPSPQGLDGGCFKGAAVVQIAPPLSGAGERRKSDFPWVEKIHPLD